MSWWEDIPNVDAIERDGYTLLDARGRPQRYKDGWGDWWASVHAVDQPDEPPQLSTDEIAPAAPNDGRGPTWWITEGAEGPRASIDFDLFDPTLESMVGATEHRPSTSVHFRQTPNGWRLVEAATHLPRPPWIHNGLENGAAWYDPKSELEYRAQLVANAKPPCEVTVYLCDSEDPNNHLKMEDPVDTSPGALWAFFRRLRQKTPWYDETQEGSPDYKSTLGEGARAKMKDEYLDMLEETGVIE